MLRLLGLMLVGTTVLGATGARSEVPIDAASTADIVVTWRAANLTGIADSASEGQIGKVDLENRPIQRTGEMLEVTLA